MKIFSRTSHKLVVFLLFVTVWTDLILPTPYKSSDFVFWLFSMFVLTWYYFTFKVLSHLESNSAKQFRMPFYIALGLLFVGLTSDWLIGFDTAHFNGTNINLWKGICFAFISFVIGKLLLASEKEPANSLKGLGTFGLIFVLPIGAWWIHQRLQKVAFLHQSQAVEL